jgi:hypothetical protein
MNSENPLVSIIIPVFNGSNYLSEAIDSAIAQTYPNIEILVINDGSTDHGKTEKIAKSYGNKIRYFLKKNGGVASALNYGIKQMKGEWFSWLSHDDMYTPTKITELINYISLHSRAKILYTDYELVNVRGDHLHNISVRPTDNDNMQLRLIDSYPLNGCAMLIRKDCFTKVGKFDEKLHTTQDYDLWFRLAEKYQFEYVPISSIKSRQHSEQDSHSNNHKDEVDALYSKFIRNISLSTIKLNKGNDSGRWLLHVAQIYKQRGYTLSPFIVLKKYQKIIKNPEILYLITLIYCQLPNNLTIKVADFEHNSMRLLFLFTGFIKSILRKIMNNDK